MQVLTASQAKAAQTYIAERDAAIAGLAEIFTEAGLDLNTNYQINWQTREVTVPKMADEPVMELVPVNRASRRRKKE